MQKFIKFFFVGSLVLFLNACGSVEAEDPLDEVLPTGDASDGLAVYTANCLECHAADLTGDSGPSLLSVVENEIRTAVRAGAGSMPTFSKTAITSQELSDLIEYIEAF